MPDISMCNNSECPRRATCRRYIATPSAWQWWAVYDHRDCPDWWDANGYQGLRTLEQADEDNRRTTNEK